MSRNYGGDIECFGASDRFICGTWCYRDKETNKMMYKTFENKKDYEEWIIKEAKEQYKKTRKEINAYFHNTSYDLFRFADLKEKNYIKGEKEGYKIINLSKKAIIDYCDINGNTLINYQDTSKIMYKSLEEIGEIIGVKKERPKKETEDKFHTEKESELTKEEIEEIKKYNKRDAEICLLLIERIKEILKEEKYNPKKMITIGQLAIGLFNKRIKELKLEPVIFKWEKNKELAFKIIKYEETKYPMEIIKACRTGRIEANRTGRYKDCTNIDYNSLYPESMCRIEFPNLKTENRIEKPTEIFKEEEILNTIGISECTIECPKQKVGYLPIRIAIKLKSADIDIRETIYPKHKCVLKGIWTNYELKKATERGYKIKDIDYTIIYGKIREENPLKTHLMELYKKREKGKLENALYKGLMNNLHGKFAQRNEDKKYIIDDADLAEEYENEGYKIETRMGTNYLYSLSKGRKPAKTFAPIISAYTTAMAREIMYNEITKINEKDYLYCGTDSIVFKGPDNIKKFEIGKELGKFKIIKAEGEELINKTANIYGKNNYIIGNEKRISGVRKETINKIKEIEKPFEFDKFKSINEVMELDELYSRKWNIKDLKMIEVKTKGLEKYIRKQKIIEDASKGWKGL